MFELRKCLQTITQQTKLLCELARCINLFKKFCFKKAFFYIEFSKNNGKEMNSR